MQKKSILQLERIIDIQDEEIKKLRAELEKLRLMQFEILTLLGENERSSRNHLHAPRAKG